MLSIGCAKSTFVQNRFSIRRNQIITIKCQATVEAPQKENISQAKKQKNAIVVGGGVGGLITAGLLAKNGIKTTIVEKNDKVGGRMQSEVYGECRFDTGPSLLIFPSSYRQIYKMLGENFDDHVKLLRVEPQAYRVFQEDNSYLDIFYDMQKMTQQLDDIEPGAGTAFMEWLNTARIMYDFGWPSFIETDLQTISDIPKLLKVVPQALRVNLLDILDKHFNRMAGRFKDPRLRSFITFQDLYIGLSPYNAPSVYSLLAGGELTEGVWYPEGGFQQVRDTLVKILQNLGVEILTNQKVETINVKEEVTEYESSSKVDYKVKGVTVNGKNMEADVIITNIDVPCNYTMLQNGKPKSQASAPQNGSPAIENGSAAASYQNGKQNGAQDIYKYQDSKKEKYDKMEYSNAVISYYWSIKGEVPQIRHHNIFLSADYQKAWIPAKTADELCSRPNFYCCAPRRSDPTVCKEELDSVMILFPIATLQETTYENHEQMIQAGKKCVLEAFKQIGADISDRIVNEEIRTPKIWEEMYNLKYGAAFGLAHGLNQLAVFRPATKEGKVQGLYRTGASTRPGNGVPLCMNSGKFAARAVLREQYNIILDC